MLGPLLLAVVLASPVALPLTNAAVLAGPVVGAGVAIDCLGTYAAAGVAAGDLDWSLVLRWRPAILLPDQDDAWRTASFEARGPAFERAGALAVFPARGFHADLYADGAWVAGASCDPLER